MTSRKTTSRSSYSTEDPTTDWAKQVVAGKIVAGPHIRNAARRHLEDLKRGSRGGLAFDRQAAQRAIDFFGKVLRLSKSNRSYARRLRPLLAALFRLNRQRNADAISPAAH